MLGKNRKIVVIGSYRQNLEGILALVGELSRRGHTLLYPGPSSRATGQTEGFVRLDQDEHENEGEQQRVVFRCIDDADMVIAFNPDRRLGSSAALEIGYSLCKGKPVYTTSIPSDITLRKLTTTLDLGPSEWNSYGSRLYDIVGEYSNRDTMMRWRQGDVNPLDGGLDIIDSIETHTCIVFFSSTHAFKIRKSVDLGFLDYSTPDKRLACAMEELEMGRRIAPNVYTGLWYYSFNTGRFDPVRSIKSEPVVIMRKLPTEIRGDIVFKPKIHDQAKPERIDIVVKWLLAFHNSNPANLDENGWGSPAAVLHAWKVNFEQMPNPKEDVSVPLRSNEWQDIQQETEAWFAEIKPVLARRLLDGRVRRTHGDLRVEHIYLTELIPSVIDPLEFDLSLSFTDVAAEVAFLAMTLESIGRSDVASRLESRYAEGAGDSSLREVLPFFKRYRAIVRMKVEWLRALQLPFEERTQALKKARAFAELALSYRR